MTYRQIAERAGVSITAVSFALNNQSGVSEETRKQVYAAAKELGYRPNPLVTALMQSQRKRRRQRKLRAVIGCMIPNEIEPVFESSSYLKNCFVGAKAACIEAGFLFEKLHWEDFGGSSQRLFSVLRARRIPGVVLLGGDVPLWCLQGWDHCAVASAGNRRINLPCHFALADLYREVLVTIDRLQALGYRRIGCALTREEWMQRTDYRALAAYAGWAIQAGIEMGLLHWAERWAEKPFLNWVEAQRPDVVLSVSHKPFESLCQAGYRIPADIGFVHLGLEDSWHQFAGIRQNHREVGYAAAQMVIEQINRNTYGMPAHQRSVFVVGDWFRGPTVRRQKRKSEAAVRPARKVGDA